MNDVKRCSKCKILSILSNFNENTKSKDGLQFQFKLSVNLYNKN